MPDAFACSTKLVCLANGADPAACKGLDRAVGMGPGGSNTASKVLEVRAGASPEESLPVGPKAGFTAALTCTAAIAGCDDGISNDSLSDSDLCVLKLAPDIPGHS